MLFPKITSLILLLISDCTILATMLSETGSWAAARIFALRFQERRIALDRRSRTEPWNSECTTDRRRSATRSQGRSPAIRFPCTFFSFSARERRCSFQLRHLATPAL